MDEDDLILNPYHDQQIIKGSLCFSENVILDPSTIEKFNVAPMHAFKSLNTTLYDQNSKIIFNVDSARIVAKDGQKYVAYTILLTTPLNKSLIGKIERRYTDFCYLHAELKNLNFITIKEIAFPERIMIGNFKYNNIIKRSRSFESYLRQLITILEIANSLTFQYFLHGPELRQCLSLIQEPNYPQTLQSLKNLINLQSILFEFNDPKVIMTTAVLGVIYSLATEYKKAWDMTLNAFYLSIGLSDVVKSKDCHSEYISYPEIILETLETNSETQCNILSHPWFIHIVYLLSDLAWVLGYDKDNILSIIQKIKSLEESSILHSCNKSNPQTNILKCFISHTSHYLTQ